MKRPIYLDYLATTPVDPRVAERMMGCLTLDGNFGNPASRSHAYGWQAEAVVEAAREQLAALINADSREIVWTSGATEANNLALKGLAHARRERGRHLVTTAIEHKSVLDSCAQLEREGFAVTYLTPDALGRVHPSQVAEALRPDTVLVSVMHANNEIGTVNGIAAIGAMTRARDIAFHVDAAQSVGKIAVDVRAMQVDLLSVSAHKCYGPKGIGALYVGRQPRMQLQAQMHGGGHERGLRSGTLATHQIAGLGEAMRLAQQEMAAEADRLRGLRDRLWQGLAAVGGVTRHGDVGQGLPGCLNVSFAGVDGEALLLALKDLAVSSGSACTSATLEPSYVLRAIGVPEALAHSAIRFGLGRFTTAADIDAALAQIAHALPRLRRPARPPG